MKKASKILLSALLMFSMMFTMTVNAEEQTPTTPQDEQTPTVQQSTPTSKGIADLTEADFNSIIPSSIDVAMTKTEYANILVENEYGIGYDKADAKIKEKIISLFSDNGYTIESSKINVYIFSDLVIDKKTIAINNFKKEVTINFTKEQNYNATDETYVKNAVNNIKLAKYTDIFGGGTYDAVFTMYDINDKEADVKFGNRFNELTNKKSDFNYLINDSSITIKHMAFSGGHSYYYNGVINEFGYILYIYKNNVLYATKEIRDVGAYGTTLENGTSIAMGKLNNVDNKDIFTEMAKELNKNGCGNIIGAYELTAYGTTTDNMKVSFTLGNEYNGKGVKILHKKHDNTYELFTTTVENGKATITVSEFSPFMIALSDSNDRGTAAPSEDTNNTTSAPNNAQTSSIDIVLYSILAIGSLLGITYIVVKNRKKVA